MYVDFYFGKMILCRFFLLSVSEQTIEKVLYEDDQLFWIFIVYLKEILTFLASLGLKISYFFTCFQYFCNFKFSHRKQPKHNTADSGYKQSTLLKIVFFCHFTQRKKCEIYGCHEYNSAPRIA